MLRISLSKEQKSFVTATQNILLGKHENNSKIVAETINNNFLKIISFFGNITNFSFRCIPRRDKFEPQDKHTKGLHFCGGHLSVMCLMLSKK